MLMVRLGSLWNCETCFHYKNGKCDTWCDSSESYRPNYSKLQIIEAEPVVYGKWISKDIGFLQTVFVCSVCGGWEHDLTYKHEGINFCPNCGASMDV